MIEVIKHLTGACGEGHMTIWHFFATSTLSLTFITITIKNWINGRIRRK